MISDNEKKAMEEISELYGGTCTYSMNSNLSTKHGKRSHFEIEVSNSDFFNENHMWTEMHASNFAYIFLKHVRNDEKKYDNITTSIVYKNEAKINFQYSLDSVEIVSRKMDYVERIVDILKSKDYVQLDKLLLNDFLVSGQEREKYLQHLKSADSTFGDIESFTPTGFKFNYREDERDFLHISGNLKRKINDTRFSIDIRPGAEDGLYFIRYDY
jgi:hypothetical protein